MRKILQVLTYEVYIITSRSSFWLVILFPLVINLVIWTKVQSVHNQPNATSPVANPFLTIQEALKIKEDNRPQGFVDPGGLVRAYPADFPRDVMIAYADEISAREALDAGQISAFYVIATDYPQSGSLKVYMPEYKLMAASKRSELEKLINYNLLGGDEQLFRKIVEPVAQLERESLAPPETTARENNQQTAIVVCAAIMMLFSVGIIGSASLLLNSVTNERENRVLEILMVSVNPLQLLAGKIAGLGLVGLVGMLAWLPSMVVFFQVGGTSLTLPEELRLQPSFIAWGIVFFVLGYLIYAAIMATIGALLPNLREASQISSLVLLPVFIPEILIPVAISQPNHGLVVVFSLFPLTSPLMMMIRMAMADIPLWQMILSVGLLLLTVLIVIRLAAWLFRAQVIITGTSFRLSWIIKRLREAWL